MAWPIKPLFLVPSQGDTHHRNFPGPTAVNRAGLLSHSHRPTTVDNLTTTTTTDPPTQHHTRCVFSLPPFPPASPPRSLSLAAFPPPPPSHHTYLPPLLGHCIIAFDDFHSLSITHSSDTGTLVKAEHFHPLSQPSFLSNRPWIPNTSINKQGLRFDQTNKRNSKRRAPSIIQAESSPATTSQRIP
jgi:hypothetical protein